MTPPLTTRLATAAMPLLRRLEPELAHRVALAGLKLAGPWWTPPATPAALAVDCAGLHFAHPVGVAAGLDKDGDYLDALGAIGFSHIEIGTVTPQPQPGNPRPRLLRIPAATALVNRMGFNSKGVEHVVQRLQCSRFRGVRGVSIGKNAATPLERAVDDYLLCLRRVYPLADYVAINISSPNTAQLRELQTVAGLEQLLGPLQQERQRLARENGKTKPLFVKLAPDLTSAELSILATEIRRLGVDGVIATNTTVDLQAVGAVPDVYRGGGLSGEPLHRQSVAVIAQLRVELGAGFPIIGVGGITTAANALATLRAGANAIQLYTGLVYRGPALLHEILAALTDARPA